MSIIDSFDKDRMGIINPEVVSQKSPHKLRVLIINFSYKIMDALLENDLVELIDAESVSTVANRYPVYRFKGTDIGIVKTSIGAPMAAGMIEEIGHIFTCEKFVLFGSGGGLDKTIPPSKLIVPTHAYRDEGMSYHYAPAADYIEIRNSGRVAEILTQLGVDFVSGKTWTTDAFYRETKRNMEKEST
jgi:uridine phosphorylase